MNKLFLIVLGASIIGCSTKNCREVREEAGTRSVSKEHDPLSKTAQADRVRVYKPDGSLQCGMGDPVKLETMQKQLGGIKVHRSFNKNDGLMRAQVCGSSTGNSNVYEIDRKDLAAAQKAGFKEWTFE
jgi:hypothetical protein